MFKIGQQKKPHTMEKFDSSLQKETMRLRLGQYIIYVREYQDNKRSTKSDIDIHCTDYF